MSARHRRAILRLVHGGLPFHIRIHPQLEGQEAVDVIHAMQEFQEAHSGGGCELEGSDIVVWFQGQPTDPAMSRIGGRPFWPRGVEWPRDRHGEPFAYIAHINLEDSRDVLPEGCEWTHVFWFQDLSVDVDGSWALGGGLPIRAIGIRVEHPIESDLPATHSLGLPERHGALVRVRELKNAVDYSGELEKAMEGHGFIGMLPEHIAAPPFTKIGGLPPLGASGVGDDGHIGWSDEWDGRTRSICQIRLPFGEYPWMAGCGMIYEQLGYSRCVWVWE